MADVIYSSFQIDDGTLGEYDHPPLAGCVGDKAGSASKEDAWLAMDDNSCRFMDLFSSVSNHKEQHIMETKSGLFGHLQHKKTSDQHHYQNLIMPMEIEHHELDVHPHEFTKETPYSSSPPSSSWDLWNNYFKGLKKLPLEKDTINAGEHTLSTEEILMAGGERFIQFSTNRVDGISTFIHPYSGSWIVSGLSMEDARDVELVHLLLSAAENVGTQLFNLATKLISHCLRMASDSGSPVQRLTFYFAEALRDKVNRETAGRSSSNYEKQPKKQKKSAGLALGTNNAFLASHQELPFVQATQLAAIQAVIEHVMNTAAGDHKIHLIDLQIRSGIQWTALMQGLAEYTIKRLRITAVGTADQLLCIEETGKRLQSFAQSLDLPFSFEVVYLTDMGAFKEDLLSIEDDETVGVYSYMMLRSMISKPDVLENVMRAIARLKPTLMVVCEVEANHNSPSFVGRFTEALLFYGAFFDCLEDCMDSGSQYRRTLEGIYLSQGILDIVAADGEERVTRNVKLEVWRAFFARFGMTEIEVSESSRYQASLVLKHFAKGGSCTLESNGKGLNVEWKGTPLHSLTAWNFSS